MAAATPKPKKSRWDDPAFRAKWEYTKAIGEWQRNPTEANAQRATEAGQRLDPKFRLP